MFQSKPTICCKRNRHRTLRSESLEKRELLSVSPMACLGKFVPPENDQVACEENKLIEAKVDFSLDYKTPTGEIHIPETIDGFPFGRNPGDFDQMPGSELGQTTPLPDGVDPGKLPGWGCPDKAEPCTPTPWVEDECSEKWFQWWLANGESDITCNPDAWSADFVEVVQDWGDDPNNPLDENCDGTPDEDEETQDDDSEEEDDVMEFTEEETGLFEDVENDPNPEGDDPDELDAKIVDQAFAMYNPAIASRTTPDINNLPRTGERDAGEDDPWERHRQEINDRGTVDPEDGGPDEITSPALALVDAAMLSGFDRYPTPDDTDGPTDPRASVGESSTMMATGSVASPPDGGQGEQPIPVGPEFSRLVACGAF